MSLSEISSRPAILAAIAEYDLLGRDAFLEKYGFGRSLTYYLVHDGREYDSKAIAAWLTVSSSLTWARCAVQNSVEAPRRSNRCSRGLDSRFGPGRRERAQRSFRFQGSDALLLPPNADILGGRRWHLASLSN